MSISYSWKDRPTYKGEKVDYMTLRWWQTIKGLMPNPVQRHNPCVSCELL